MLILNKLRQYTVHTYKTQYDESIATYINEIRSLYNNGRRHTYKGRYYEVVFYIRGEALVRLLVTLTNGYTIYFRYNCYICVEFDNGHKEYNVKIKKQGRCDTPIDIKTIDWK